MIFNFPIILLAALVPLVVGAIWYNPKVLGNAWMKSCGFTEEDLKGANMILIFGLTYLFSLMLGTVMNVTVIHQNHVYSILVDEAGFMQEGSDLMVYLQDFMEKYGSNYRTFKHGAFHGVLSGIFFALPVVGILALFERRRFPYIAIHTGYWIISLALMGGIICAYS
ncbi:MAG TPA: DUF1761 domain-containing protein [Saprospiraceae bacterium]|nr:DUF1761 domain-containing protein [Saprospiraceae bacterium]HMQ81493.1 DUF1761 domain-containing protein [Saprospiraceae bacterium]